jgi:hypothetical protein
MAKLVIAHPLLAGANHPIVIDVLVVWSLNGCSICEGTKQAKILEMAEGSE